MRPTYTGFPLRHFAAGWRSAIPQGAAYRFLHGDLRGAEVQRDLYVSPLQAAATTPLSGVCGMNTGAQLVLRDRILDHGYAKLDLGGSYNLLSWLGIYGQAENLLNERNIAPIGYPVCPITFGAACGFSGGLEQGSNC